MKIAQHSSAIISKSRKKKIMNAFFTFQMGLNYPLSILIQRIKLTNFTLMHTLTNFLTKKRRKTDALSRIWTLRSNERFSHGQITAFQCRTVGREAFRKTALPCNIGISIFLYFWISLHIYNNTRFFVYISAWRIKSKSQNNSR